MAANKSRNLSQFLEINDQRLAEMPIAERRLGPWHEVFKGNGQQNL
jgi:hypothetical protein